MAIYAVGDIHGHADKLKSLINQMPLTADDRIVFVGDYIDRGYHSKQVISFLLQLKKHCNCTFLCGNHEDMILDYIEGCPRYDTRKWMDNGGRQCIASYNITNSAPGRLSLPISHVEFLDSLKQYHKEAGFVFVHGGLEPGLSAEKTRRYDRLWQRSAFVASRYCWPEGVVVFGHTPFTEPLVEDNKIGIDTGCGHGGRLTAVRLPEVEFYQV